MNKSSKCSSCGSTNGESSKFCTSCGNKLLGASSPSRPASTIVKPTLSSGTATTTSKSFLAPTIKPAASTATPNSRATISTSSVTSKPTTTTTTSTVTPKSILKSTTTTTASSPTKSSKPILKPTTTTTTSSPTKSSTTTTTTAPTTRPKSHTVSSQVAPSITKPNSATNLSVVDSEPLWSGKGSFVKMAAKSRETLDSKAIQDSKILQGYTAPPVTTSKSTLSINHKKTISTPDPSSQTKKPTPTNTTSHTPPAPTITTRPQSMSVSVSSKSSSSHSLTSPTSNIKSNSDKNKDLERLEQKIQQDKEKFIQKEREEAKKSQIEYEAKKQLEKEKNQLERENKQKSEKKAELEKEKEKEKEQKEREERLEKERQKLLERDKQKQQEREEKERLQQERDHQKQLEREEKERLQQEREKQKQLEREEKEHQKQLEREEKERRKAEREKYHTSPVPSTISSRKDSNSSTNSNNNPPSLPNSSGSLPIMSASHINNDDSCDVDEAATISSSPVTSFEQTTEKIKKNKRDREKYSSKIFSLFSRKDEDDEELVISSPGTPNGNHQYSGSNSASPSPTPDSPSQSHIDDNSSDNGTPNGNSGEVHLRKWAIKRNELQRSENNLFSPSSPASSSIFIPVGSQSPGSSSGSLVTTPSSSSLVKEGQSTSASTSSFVPSSSPSMSPSSPSSSFVTSTPSIGSTHVVMGTSRISSPNPPPDLPQNMPQAVDQRDRVIEEIIVTEADYIRDLEIMVWLKKEMVVQDNDCKGGTLEEINSLFSNVEQLLLVNKELYKKFCNFDNSFATPNATFIDFIANGFVSMADFLKVYFVYCSNQQKALSTYSALKGKNCTYLAYLLTRRECRSLPFDSFLIKPVQRVCKYPLLIRELIKSTPQDSISYINLLNAQSKIESIVLTVNEKKREFDSLMKMLELQNRITESGDNTKILSPSRKLIREGPIQSWGSTTPTNQQSFIFKKKNKEGYYYLFNDLFLYCEVKMVGVLNNTVLAPLKVKCEISFELCYILDTILDDCAFELKNLSTISMFSLETVEERNALFNDIKGAFESHQSILKEYQSYIIALNQKQQQQQHQQQQQDQDQEKSSYNPLSSSSSSIGGISVSSSDILSMDEWRQMVRNKPLPALPTNVLNNNGNNSSGPSSPSASRISKALPVPPPPPKN
ncbi:hypothetical protein DICPUDRAFT_155148 [Dictyostelium purpureum]|uniref:DH domain-containing protein n=1 Tax=Dictyostelium purpureum TaxID=5786 RepID=F0ZT71_DICPU|nr:uncharacterized protein DICPUDRAFT_155148 [Dictyostelium purpureum]EGC32855.1 hypothetical protein DICPUDRAFT_155148 [Dictyostelium purpureum]|eukprot:XP_003290607.1 hypothetical protein DICPUDRAFT_155148 [Dictyostelium purpureum]